jgi:type I restriction enzyme, S subunit
MIADLKPYPAMKDSGVEWLGEVPEHWEIRRNGRLFSQRNETGYPDLPILEVSLRTGIRVRSFEKSERKQVMSDRDKYKRSAKGDIAYNMMRMWQGAVGIAPVDGLISPAYVVARPLSCTDSRYYRELFRTDAYMREVDKYSRGIVKDRNRLYWEDFKSMPSPFLPLPEQAAIVRYLDHVGRRVRRLTRAKQKLIKLLEEQKRAIIHRAVTRGLDPDVPLKDSGVEWLGEVPEHWEVRRNGRLFVQRNETGCAELPILEVSLRTGVRVRDFEKSDRKQVMSDRDKYKRAAKGDIAYNMMRMWQGAVGVAPVDGLISPAYVVARPLAGTNVCYFEKLFRTAVYMQEIDNYSRGIVKDRNRLYWEDFRAMPTCYPPPEEQEQIADAIDQATTNIDTGITRAEREIDLLNEYRTRLIADVVTGNLDVRKAADSLPEADPLADDEPKDGIALDTEKGLDKTDVIPEEAET